jgi:hypothetical protein
MNSPETVDWGDNQDHIDCLRPVLAKLTDYFQKEFTGYTVNDLGKGTFPIPSWAEYKTDEFRHMLPHAGVPQDIANKILPEGDWIRAFVFMAIPKKTILTEHNSDAYKAIVASHVVLWNQVSAKRQGLPDDPPGLFQQLAACASVHIDQAVNYVENQQINTTLLPEFVLKNVTPEFPSDENMHFWSQNLSDPYSLWTTEMPVLIDPDTAKAVAYFDLARTFQQENNPMFHLKKHLT